MPLHARIAFTGTYRTCDAIAGKLAPTEKYRTLLAVEIAVIAKRNGSPQVSVSAEQHQHEVEAGWMGKRTR